MIYTHFLFDWGNTLMEDLPGQIGPMALWPEVKVVASATDILRQLSQQGRCYIATNANDSSAQNIRQALRRGNLDEFISDIFCYQEIGHKKPDTAYFTAILESLDVQKTSVVMIGDSLENDVYGALNAGIDAVWFNRHGAACPDNIHSIAALHELPALLRNMSLHKQQGC